MDVSSALDIVGRPGFLTQVKYAADGYRFDTREDTYVSAVTAFVKDAAESVVEEVDKYAHFWGISGEVERAREKWARYKTLPEPSDNDYALRVEHNGEPIRKFAAYNAGSTVEAAKALHQNRYKMPYAWRKEAAANLLSRASAFEAVLPEYLERSLEKMAGYGAVSEDALRDALSQRFPLVHARFSDARAKLAEFVETLVQNEDARYQTGMVVKTAEAFEQFDRELGLTRYYETGEVGLPEDVIGDYSTLSSLQKVAACVETDPVRLVNGFELDVDSLDKTALAAVDPDLTKLSNPQLVDVLPTIPREDADLLQRLVS